MITFEGLGLDSKLIQATDALGFKNPTPIQEKAIPVLLSGTKDLVGLAQTGTGKTAAFGLPLLQLVESKDSFSLSCTDEGWPGRGLPQGPERASSARGPCGIRTETGPRAEATATTATDAPLA